jgi:hypothetical protein
MSGDKMPEWQTRPDELYDKWRSRGNIEGITDTVEGLIKQYEEIDRKVSAHTATAEEQETWRVIYGVLNGGNPEKITDVAERLSRGEDVSSYN